MSSARRKEKSLHAAPSSKGPSSPATAGGSHPPRALGQKMASLTVSPATAGGGHTSPSDSISTGQRPSPRHQSPTTTEQPPTHIPEQTTEERHRQKWADAVLSQQVRDSLASLLQELAKNAPQEVTEKSIIRRVGAAEANAGIVPSESELNTIVDGILQHYHNQIPRFKPLVEVSGFQPVTDIPLLRNEPLRDYKFALNDDPRDANAISVVLGPSGSGKTTFMEHVLPRYVVEYTYEQASRAEQTQWWGENHQRSAFVRIVLLSEVLAALEKQRVKVDASSLAIALWNHVKTSITAGCNLVLAVDEAGVNPSLFSKGSDLKAIYRAVKKAAKEGVVGLHLSVGGTGLATSLGNLASNTPGIAKLRLGPWKEEHIKNFLKSEEKTTMLLSSPLLGKVATNPRMLSAIKRTLSQGDRWDTTPNGQLALARIAMSRYRAQNGLRSVELYDSAGQTGLLRGVAACALRAAMCQPPTFNQQPRESLDFHEEWATHCGLVDDTAEVGAAATRERTTDDANGKAHRFEMSPAIVVLCADMLGLELHNLVHDWDTYEQLVVLHDALLLAASSQGQLKAQTLSHAVSQPLPTLLREKEFPYCPPIRMVELEGGAPQNSVRIPVKVKGSDETMLVVRNGRLGGAADSYSPWRISQHKYSKQPVDLWAELAKMGVLNARSTNSAGDKKPSTAAQKAFVDNWIALWKRLYPQDRVDPGCVVRGLKNHKNNTDQHIGQRKMYPTHQLAVSRAKPRTEFVTALWDPKIELDALKTVFSRALDKERSSQAQLETDSDDAMTARKQEKTDTAPDTDAVKNKEAFVQESANTGVCHGEQPGTRHARLSTQPTPSTAQVPVDCRLPVLELCFALSHPVNLSTGSGACIQTSDDDDGNKTRVVMERSIIALCEKDDTGAWVVDLSMHNTSPTGKDYVGLLKQELASCLRVDVDVATIVVRFACAEL